LWQCGETGRLLPMDILFEASRQSRPLLFSGRSINLHRLHCPDDLWRASGCGAWWSTSWSASAPSGRRGVGATLLR